MHHSHNTLSKCYLETIGVWVSSLNHCDYCVEHHFAGLKRLLDDDQRADALRAAIELRNIDAAPLNETQKLGLVYAQQLTVGLTTLTKDIVIQLRSAGLNDGEVLEINQVTAYFNYANRTVLGLGVITDGDILGLSPGNNADSEDWNHI